MAVSSLSLNYDAVLSTTLFNYHATLEDEISTSNALLYYLMRKEETGYIKQSSIGERYAISLRYENGAFDSYAGYDQLDTTPMDGISQAFFDWRQASTPISISGLEEKKNAGEERIFNLLMEKTQQAVDGIKEGFSKAMFQGQAVNDNTSPNIETAYVSPTNGSSFIDPLPLLVSDDGTGEVGNINSATYSWWANQTGTSAATTYAGLRKELRKLRNDCSKGVGGFPNLHIADQATFEVYVAALEAMHQNPSYQKADIPFDSVAFYGNPVVWDEYMPNWIAGTTTQSTSQGSWLMLNTKFWRIVVHSATDFAPTAFVKPENQDARTSHILWLGTMAVSNRRKHGVLHTIDTTLTS